jgi:hypothetical protein
MAGRVNELCCLVNGVLWRVDQLHGALSEPARSPAAEAEPSDQVDRVALALSHADLNGQADHAGFLDTYRPLAVAAIEAMADQPQQTT